jgi:hypothetical protein
MAAEATKLASVWTYRTGKTSIRVLSSKKIQGKMAVIAAKLKFKPYMCKGGGYGGGKLPVANFCDLF